MKLWQKLSLVAILVLLAATGVSGTAVIYRSALYNQQKTVENYEQQLKSTAYVLGKELENSSLGTYSEVAKNSYFNFLIKKFGASQYILIEKGQVVCNLTPFEFVNPKDERWNQAEGCSIIQKSGKQHILIAGKEVSVAGSPDFCLVLVQDISALYQDIRNQILVYLTIYFCAALMAVAAIFSITGKILSPLRELQKAAQAISEGQFERRADVRTRDEIGALAKSFNKMADKIESQVKELSQVSERQRQLLGSLTHELKTPMTSIIGYSDTLLHVKLKKEQQERAFLHIYEECSRLERLSGKLMCLIGLYENDSICMEEVSMQELFERVAELEACNLQQKKIRLVSACSMKKRTIDRDLFESLLINLIDNGIKASSEGDTIFLEGEENRITVRDQGCGIPEEEMNRVTEAFYMVDKARSRKAGGCGLGLALCSRIAGLHHARLLIDSRQGEGTCVTILFEELLFPEKAAADHVERI